MNMPRQAADTAKAPRPIVGIDLGTTNSLVAWLNDGRPEILPSPEGRRIIPSVVMLDLEGKVRVGEAARASLVAMPDRVVAAVKRRMGSSEPVLLAGQPFLPQEISAMILKELKRHVDARFGGQEVEAVITVPAYFTDEQRRATKQAGELAGFVVERIINEPTAAAMAFGLRHLDAQEHILVYDLGGGTFDVSVVEMADGVLEVRASAGNNRLGGEDFDWRLVDWLAKKISRASGVDPRQDLRAKSLLKEQAERIKIALSEAERVPVELPLVTMQDNRPVGLFTEITRQEFEAMIEDLLASTLDCVRQVLQDARLKPQDIGQILLVGGSTRIPRVRQLVTEFFGRPARHDVHPDEAVALGAAVQAGLKAGLLADAGLVVTDVAPFSLGVAVIGEYQGVERPGVHHVIIPRNTTIPVAKTERLYTSAPGQTVAQIEIYQGEHQLVKHNHCLGRFKLRGIPANWHGQQPIDITYRYNLNGILEVTACCPVNNRMESLTVHDTLNRDSEEAFAASVEKLKALYEGTGSDHRSPQLLDAADTPDDEDEDAWERDAGLAASTPEALRLELANLFHRLAPVAKAAKGRQRKQALKWLDRIGPLLADEGADPAEMQALIEEVMDFLIDLELGED